MSVLYFDGELPAGTFKERMQFIAPRYGAEQKLYGYNPDCQAPFWNENLGFFSNVAINSENMRRPCSHY
jgi:hypothetical protein